MTTIFKIQLSIIGNKAKNAFSTTSRIEIVQQQPPSGTANLRPFRSLPSERKSYSSDSDENATLSISMDDDEELPRYSLLQVLTHDIPSDCWVIVYDRVYDLTNFLYKHPGGDEIILEYAGRDATVAFRSAGHSQVAETVLEPYLIGILEEKDRLRTHLWDTSARRGSR